MNHLRQTCLLLLGGLGAVANAQSAPHSPSPTDSPPPIPRAAFITNMNSEYAAMDSNKDGKVTKAEIEARLRAAAADAERLRNRQVFQSLDADHNGQLSPAEFAHLVPQANQPNGQSLLQKFDSNRDGTITIIEYRTGTLANFDKMDTDKDGVVTPAEMRAAGIGQK